MSSRSDQAVVIRLSDYSESSQIVSLFSAGAGQVRLIGKGVNKSTKKRVAVGFDLLELGDVDFVPPRGDAGRETVGSLRTASGFTSSRSPRYVGWRSFPSAVHSVNFTSARSRGLTQWARSLVRGMTAKGLVFVLSAWSAFQTRPSSASVNPAPV